MNISNYYKQKRQKHEAYIQNDGQIVAICIFCGYDFVDNGFSPSCENDWFLCEVADGQNGCKNGFLKIQHNTNLTENSNR